MSLCRNLSFAVVLAAFSAGCVTIQMPDVAQSHPAHPEAEPAAVPNIPSVLDTTETPVVAPPLSAAGEPSPAHGHGGHTGHVPPPAAPDQALYVCPMHPEVISDAPGTCPLCGMDLVPQGETP